MPIESIKCPDCGSSDVTKLRSGSYVCQHCESVFKVYDPQVVTIAPAFCGCGRVVEVQCQRCEAKICGHCNAAVNNVKVRVPTTQGGYPYKNGAILLDGRLILTADPCLTSDIMDGNFCWARDVISEMKKAYGQLDRLCWACVEEALPLTSNLPHPGRLCSAENCDELSTTECGRCQRPLCSRCPRSVYAGWAIGVFRYSSGDRETDQGRAQHIVTEGVPRISSQFCSDCRSELQGQVQTILDEYEHVGRPYTSVGGFAGFNRAMYPSPDKNGSGIRSQRKEIEKITKQAERYAKEIGERLTTLVRSINDSLPEAPERTQT